MAEQSLSVFPVGDPNTAFAQYFIGQSYLAPLTLEQVPTFNVTFEPRCRNNWHIHHASEGGGQMLICVFGRSWYQEWGKESSGAPSRRRGEHPRGCQALARSRQGQLVSASGH